VEVRWPTFLRADPEFRWLHRTAAVVAFAVVPGMWVLIVVIGTIWFPVDNTGFDLKYAYLPAAEDVLDGTSPYPDLDDPVLYANRAYVYPPLSALVLAPVTAVPMAIAVDFGVILTFASALAVLALVGVRDWRCYAIAAAWAPVVNSAVNATVSLPLAVLAAAAWRWRDRDLSSGVLLGSAAAVKTMMWPLLLWHASVGRWRGTGIALASAAALVLGPWAVIGFEDLTYFPQLLRRVTEIEERQSYSLSAVVLELGAGEAFARAVTVVVTVGLLVAAFAFGRRGDEARAFVAILLTTLAATPILWQHYLGLLLVPLAIAMPRLTVWWLLPLALYLAPWTGNGDLWQTLFVPSVVVAIGTACLVRAGARTDPVTSSLPRPRPQGASRPSQTVAS
jgi:hypothetical protein